MRYVAQPRSLFNGDCNIWRCDSFSAALLRIAADDRALQQLSTALACLGGYKLAKDVLCIDPSNEKLNTLREDLNQSVHVYQMILESKHLDPSEM